MRALAAVSLVLVLTGCPEKKPAEADASMTMDAAVVDAATGSKDMAADAAVAEMKDAGPKTPHHDMAHCPSAVPGATVALKDVEGGIEVSITGKDEAMGKDIRERMSKLAQAGKTAPDAGVHHNSDGSGHGTFGRCTVVMKNTRLETADIPNGTKATVKALDKSEVDYLRRETRDRDREAKMATSEGAGVHRMAHCPSAVEGSKTVVKDTKDGVVVTVTGPADKVADIRDRAKHVAEVAKKGDAAKVEHTGNGTGGGGIGRCPIDVEGDTTVELKDVEGGVEATVKAKKDAAALQKETKLRAANFGK